MADTILVQEPTECIQPKIDKAGEAPNFTDALNKFAGNSKDLNKSSLKSLIKTLRKLGKKPKDPKARRLLMANIVVKKYVVGAKGAVDFLEALGFKKISQGGKDYLQVEEDTARAHVASETLEQAIAALQAKLDGLDSETKEVKPVTGMLCAAGCGFWGKPDTENMCSQCYGKKHGQNPAKKEPSKPPVMCKNGCGFYGRDQFEGLCSLCYKKNHPEAKVVEKHWKKCLNSAVIKLRAMRRFQLGKPTLQKKKNHCWKCKRKVGITGLECRCRYIFCGKHRYPHEHDCPYDFKKAHKSQLKKDNIVVAPKRLGDRLD